ncbi:MAG TPA: alpha/beta fold hydrolase, partial [Ilumatobacteraceae bacterium]|nr:alpha/beta fold hydrolase [Ilumatobacteraceae bacterium]
ISYAWLTIYSVPPQALPTHLFPLLFGARAPSELFPVKLWAQIEWWGYMESFVGVVAWLLALVALGRARERMVAWLQSMVYDESFVTDELIDLRMSTATEPDVLAASRMMYSRAGLAMIRQSARATDRPAPWAHLPKIQCPTLITWGRDDRVTPMDWALLPMRLIPKCELHVFYDCGHWAMIERKAEFDSVVLSFLNRER